MSSTKTPKRAANESRGKNPEILRCICGKVSERWESKQGKIIYKCATGKCTLHEFHDELPAHIQRAMNRLNKESDSIKFKLPNTKKSEPLLCYCGKKPLKATMEEGPDKNRVYFKCANPKKTKCDLSEWEDELLVNVKRTMKAKNTYVTTENSSRKRVRQPLQDLYHSKSQDQVSLLPWLHLTEGEPVQVSTEKCQ